MDGYLLPQFKTTKYGVRNVARHDEESMGKVLKFFKTNLTDEIEEDCQSSRVVTNISLGELLDERAPYASS